MRSAVISAQVAVLARVEEVADLSAGCVIPCRSRSDGTLRYAVTRSVEESFWGIDLEAQVRRDHPLRLIREVATAGLSAMGGESAGLHAAVGRGRVPPRSVGGR